ncbi:hypothetical protein [Schinkia azotoformans]|uniref:hypothetical protein n=1 Tax=Schinkia azotoformans TaxID=1454 RepID=UPI002DBF6938|nr:hypothetical protein [Schinkia azotoformans]MEC1718409.1 hypothetical protein [Schinkia azotoformans]MEC1756232.1 hypothetical protein [Schinkia azotoformans]
MKDSFEEIMKREYLFWDIVGETTNAYFYEAIKNSYENEDYLVVISEVKKLLEHVLGDQLVKKNLYRNGMTYAKFIEIAEQNQLITSVTASKLHLCRRLRNRFDHFKKIKKKLPTNTARKAFISLSVLSKCLEELLQLSPNCNTVIYLPHSEALNKKLEKFNASIA